MRRLDTGELADLLGRGLKANEIVKLKSGASITWCNNEGLHYMLTHRGDVSLSGIDGKGRYELILGNATKLNFTQRGGISAYNCGENMPIPTTRAEINMPIILMGTEAELRLDSFGEILY